MTATVTGTSHCPRRSSATLSMFRYTPLSSYLPYCHSDQRCSYGTLLHQAESIDRLGIAASWMSSILSGTRTRRCMGHCTSPSSFQPCYRTGRHCNWCTRLRPPASIGQSDTPAPSEQLIQKDTHSQPHTRHCMPPSSVPLCCRIGRRYSSCTPLHLPVSTDRASIPRHWPP